MTAHLRGIGRWLLAASVSLTTLASARTQAVIEAEQLQRTADGWPALVHAVDCWRELAGIEFDQEGDIGDVLRSLERDTRALAGNPDSLDPDSRARVERFATRLMDGGDCRRALEELARAPVLHPAGLEDGLWPGFGTAVTLGRAAQVRLRIALRDDDAAAAESATRAAIAIDCAIAHLGAIGIATAESNQSQLYRIWLRHLACNQITDSMCIAASRPALATSRSAWLDLERAETRRALQSLYFHEDEDDLGDIADLVPLHEAAAEIDRYYDAVSLYLSLDPAVRPAAAETLAEFERLFDDDSYVARHSVLGARHLNVGQLLGSMLRAESRRRAFHVAVAIARFEQLNGDIPPDLEALVPQLLQAIPLDPFAPGHLLFRAVVGEERRYTLYSRGGDGVDDNGAAHPYANERMGPAWNPRPRRGPGRFPGTDFVLN